MSASTNFSAQQILKANLLGIERGLMIAMTMVRDEMAIILNQPGTGTPYRGGKKGTGTFRRRSVDGEPPAPETGTLQLSVQTGKPKLFAGNKFRMVVLAGLIAGEKKRSDVPRYLEFGTSRMKKRPFISPVLKEIKPLVKGLISDNMMQAVRRMQMGAQRKV